MGNNALHRNMKTVITLLFCSFFVLAANADDQIQMVRNGTNVTERPSAALATNVISLLQNCSYNSTAYAGTEESWRANLRVDSFVLLSFSTPRNLALTTFTSGPAQWAVHATNKQVKAIDQILVPLPVDGPGPDFIFARSGTNVLAFCNWTPPALRKVVFEPALHLSSTRYSSYAQHSVWDP